MILRTWDGKGQGKPVPNNIFLERLAKLKSRTVLEVRPSCSQWESAGVTLLAEQRKDYSEDVLDPKGEERFEAAIQSGLISIGKWLGDQSPIVFRNLRKAGFKTDLFIEAWIDCDQFDLDLPVTLIQACSRLRLPIKVYTND